MSNVIFKTALKLDKDLSSKIASFAKGKGVATLPVAIVDEKLLAGFVLEIDGIEYDYSLAGSLTRLAKSLEV